MRRRPIQRLLRDRPVVREELPRRWFLRLMGWFGRLIPSRERQRLRSIIHKAGLAGRLSPEELFGVKIFFSLSFAFGGFLLSFALTRLPPTLEMTLPPPFSWGIALARFLGMFLYPFWGPMILGILGFIAPSLWLSHLIAGRRKTVYRLLPDFLDLLATCVEAGLGLDAAIDRIVHRFPGPLSEEFQRYLWEVQVGRSRFEAMMGIAERTGLDDLRVLATALAQSERFGIPIANVLQAQAEDLRNRRLQRAREQAARAPIYMIPALAFCFCPVLLILLFVPLAIRIRKMGGILP